MQFYDKAIVGLKNPVDGSYIDFYTEGGDVKVWTGTTAAQDAVDDISEIKGDDQYDVFVPVKITSDHTIVE